MRSSCKFSEQSEEVISFEERKWNDIPACHHFGGISKEILLKPKSRNWL